MKNENKTVEIKRKIDSDFILELFGRLKNLEGEEKKEMIKKIEFFKRHFGEYLVK